MIDPRRYNTWPRELERLAQELELTVDALFHPEEN